MQSKLLLQRAIRTEQSEEWISLPLMIHNIGKHSRAKYRRTKNSTLAEVMTAPDGAFNAIYNMPRVDLQCLIPNDKFRHEVFIIEQLRRNRSLSLSFVELL